MQRKEYTCEDVNRTEQVEDSALDYGIYWPRE
jgi:hypothetical protein